MMTKAKTATNIMVKMTKNMSKNPKGNVGIWIIERYGAISWNGGISITTKSSAMTSS
jgi:hypothetical protein